jgi:tRNA (guanine10-N2)-dimethyltransferase
LGKSSKKIEIIITSYQNQVLVGCGIGTQNISAYRDRDQRRPKRDSKVGMLPPKLAQIIINLSRPKPASLNQKLTLLDPFCGTGVILQEAHLLGFNIVGSDIEPRMVNYSRQNLKWLSQDLDKAKLLVGDATQTKWPHFDCIASETYLGKPFGSPPNLNQITVEKNLVEPIIAKFLKNLRQQIPANSQICLAVPAWLDPNGKYTDLHLIQPKQLQKLGFRYKSFKTVKNADLIYFRPSQSVARRLLVLTPENS